MECTNAALGRIAELVKIHLTEGELTSFADEISAIKCFADKLAELDTEGQAPMFYGSDGPGLYRADVEIASYPREEMLANAPERDESCFLAPRVLDADG